jgi:hypothetical protein
MWPATSTVLSSQTPLLLSCGHGSDVTCGMDSANPVHLDETLIKSNQHDQRVLPQSFCSQQQRCLALGAGVLQGGTSQSGNGPEVVAWGQLQQHLCSVLEARVAVGFSLGTWEARVWPALQGNAP